MMPEVHKSAFIAVQESQPLKDGRLSTFPPRHLAQPSRKQFRKNDRKGKSSELCLWQSMILKGQMTSDEINK